ncbi:hypothetical protein HK104_007866 [Borealophlyctis nickersoniae]|nr:hypothetical protein HK104_007866 [Borealophlyctis nickersoniae]
MPKVKRERTKLHAVPIRVATQPMETDDMPPTKAPQETFIVQRVLPYVAPLEVTAASIQNLETGNGSGKATGEQVRGTKKDKRQQRHERWLQKLGSFYSAAGNQQMKNDDLAVNLGSMRDVLPTTEELEAGSKSKGVGTGTANRHGGKAVSQKARRKDAVNEIVRLQKVMAHPAFKNNPLAAIRQHLQNTISPEP